MSPIIVQVILDHILDPIVSRFYTGLTFEVGSLYYIYRRGSCTPLRGGCREDHLSQGE